MSDIYRKRIGKALSHVCVQEVREWEEEEKGEETLVNWSNRNRMDEKLNEKEKKMWAECGHERREDPLRAAKKIHQRVGQQITASLVQELKKRYVEHVYAIAMKMLVCEG